MSVGTRNGLRYAPGRAILYMIMAIAMQSILDAGVKWLTAGYPVPQIVFVRCLFGLVLGIALATQLGGLASLATQRPGGHLMRSLFNLGAMLSFYYALSLLPLAETVAITFAAPLFMTALSVVLLRERVGLQRWAAVVVGLLGVGLILQPAGAGMTAGAFFALGSAFFYALTLVTSRQLSSTEASHTILFYYSAGVMAIVGASGVLGATGAFPALRWVPFAAADLWVFALMGVAGSLGQFFFNQAFRYGEVSLLAPIEYTALLWGIFYGFALWGDVPSWVVLAGAAVVAGASLYIARRESRQARPVPVGPLSAEATAEPAGEQ